MSNVTLALLQVVICNCFLAVSCLVYLPLLSYSPLHIPQEFMDKGCNDCHNVINLSCKDERNRLNITSI
ncbi:hypothetical protein KY289_013833 [Solanum tuberosum]|nr:hypothetical protein KY289_013833 [Solanum tuberosum]